MILPASEGAVRGSQSVAQVNIVPSTRVVAVRDVRADYVGSEAVHVGLRIEVQPGLPVEEAARMFIEKHGAANLGKVAKMHFRTALRVQGLPEPPKVEWRRQSSRGDNEQ